MKFKLTVKATMETDLIFEDDSFELPEDIDKDDSEAVQEYIRQYAEDLDGGLFTPDDSLTGGSWNVYDVDLEKIESDYHDLKNILESLLDEEEFKNFLLINVDEVTFEMKNHSEDDDVLDVLIHAFSWGQTPQGYEYWNKVAKKFRGEQS